MFCPYRGTVRIPHTSVVYEDEHSIAFLDRQPAAEGHTLVIPRITFLQAGSWTSRSTIDGLGATDDQRRGAVTSNRLIHHAFQPDGMTFDGSFQTTTSTPASRVDVGLGPDRARVHLVRGLMKQ